MYYKKHNRHFNLKKTHDQVNSIDRYIFTRLRNVLRSPLLNE